MSARREPESFPEWTFDHLDIEYDNDTCSVWMNYRESAPHCYTLAMLRDAIEFRDSLRDFFASGLAERRPVRYFVMASNKPYVFSLGGDLAVFAASIRNHDRATLLEYAYACIDVMYGLTSAFELPLLTLSAVRGQCMGGGFEGALATDFLIAEENAKLGVPEISFNTFPGMGGVSFLGRRIGAVAAEQIISSGIVRNAREFHELGVVDILAPDGSLRETTLDFMRDGGEERWRRRYALAQLRKRCFPVTRDELARIVELWTNTAFSISEHDVRYMERLVAAQSRLPANRANSSGRPGFAAHERGGCASPPET